MKSKNTLILITIILLGLGLRLYQLGSVPVSLYWDEAAIAYDALSIAETSQDMHGGSWLQAILPSYGDYKAPLYIWLTALTHILLPATPFAVRLPSAIAGTLIILLVYGISKQLFKSEAAALAAAAFTAISPWALQFSRAAFEGNLGALFTAATFWFTLKARSQPQWLNAAAITGIAGVYAYFSVRFVVPLIVIATIIFSYKSINRRYLTHLTIAIIIFFLGLVPLYRSPHYQASQQFRLSTQNLLNTDDHILTANHYRELTGNSRISRAIYHRYWFLIERFAENVSDHLTFDYLFLTGDSNPRHSTGVTGIMLIATAPLFLLGLYVGIKRFPSATLLILTIWFTSLIPAAIPLETPHALRSLNALPVLQLILGLGVWHLFSHPFRFKSVILTILSLSIIINFIYYLEDYYQHYPVRSATAWQAEYHRVTNYLKPRHDEYQQFKIHNLDRIWLYVLYFLKIDPHTAQSASSNYLITQVDKYTTESISDYELTHYPPDTLVVVPHNSPALNINPIIKDTLVDQAGAPQFVTIETNQFYDQ